MLFPSTNIKKSLYDTVIIFNTLTQEVFMTHIILFFKNQQIWLTNQKISKTQLN